MASRSSVTLAEASSSKTAANSVAFKSEQMTEPSSQMHFSGQESIRTPLFGDGDEPASAGLALLNRIGEVAETTAAVLYLADAEFTTGHILPVDGGFIAGRAA
jgi:NAD(P)-dependent dehydrogenase (short-subunit alcohol dehydrogenase family)